MKFRNLFLALILCVSVGKAAFSASSSATGAASKTATSSLLNGRRLHPDFIKYLKQQCKLHSQAVKSQAKGHNKKLHNEKMALASRLKSVNRGSIEATPESNNLIMAIKRDYRATYPSGKIYSTDSATPPKNNPNKPNSGESATQKLKRMRVKTIAQHEQQKEQQRSYQQNLDEKKALAAKDREERLAASATFVRFVGKK